MLKIRRTSLKSCTHGLRALPAVVSATTGCEHNQKHNQRFSRFSECQLESWQESPSPSGPPGTGMSLLAKPAHLRRLVAELQVKASDTETTE